MEEASICGGVEALNRYAIAEDDCIGDGEVFTVPNVGVCVLVALKVYPEIENAPIGQRRRWNTRSRTQVVTDLQQKLGIATDGVGP